MTWSVRYYATSEPETESGATGFGSEEFARRVYGGWVQLLKDGEIVSSFTVDGGRQ